MFLFIFSLQIVKRKLQKNTNETSSVKKNRNNFLLLSPITCCAAIYSINLISKCFKAVCHDMPHWSLSRRSAEGRLTANHTIRCNQLEIKSKKWFCGPTLFHLFKRKISPWFGADHLRLIWCNSILWETRCDDEELFFKFLPTNAKWNI